MTAAVGDLWYRYEDRRYSVLDAWGESYVTKVEVVKTSYKVQRLTPKGVWVCGMSGFDKPRFIRNDARKKFASPTEKEALESLRARKLAQQRILATQLAKVAEAINQTEFLLGKPVLDFVS